MFMCRKILFNPIQLSLRLRLGLGLRVSWNQDQKPISWLHSGRFCMESDPLSIPFCLNVYLVQNVCDRLVKQVTPALSSMLEGVSSRRLRKCLRQSSWRPLQKCSTVLLWRGIIPSLLPDLPRVWNCYLRNLFFFNYVSLFCVAVVLNNYVIFLDGFYEVLS